MSEADVGHEPSGVVIGGVWHPFEVEHDQPNGPLWRPDQWGRRTFRFPDGEVTAAALIAMLNTLPPSTRVFLGHESGIDSLAMPVTSAALVMPEIQDRRSESEQVVMLVR